MFFTAADFAKADPALSAEAARLEHLLTRLEGQVKAAFEKFVRDTTDEALMAQVADLLERRDVDGALALIQTHIRAMGVVFPRLFQEAAAAELSAASGQLSATVGIAFDPGLPRAAGLMRIAQLEFVQAMSDSQRAATREALAIGLEQGTGVEPMAAAFRDSIGLAPTQVQAVANYRRLLTANSTLALDRQMRDRRFDPSIEWAIETGEPLAPAQVDRMVEAYRRRSVAFRATTIARTEGLRIMSEAQEEGFRQTMEQAGISAQDVEQSWISVDDQRTRDTHRAMRGQVRPFGVAFESPSGAKLRYPGDPLAPAFEVCNCRCKRTFRIILKGMERRAA